MQRHPPRRHPQSASLFDRIEHAAGEINPYLVVIAIGLAVLDTICVGLWAPHLAITHRDLAAPPSGIASAHQPEAPLPRFGGLQ